jgi:acyl carrier protein
MSSEITYAVEGFSPHALPLCQGQIICVNDSFQHGVIMPVTISRDDIEAVYPRVAKVIAEALAHDTGEVRLESRLFADLEAESIDLLDIVFRLEHEFNVQIPRGMIIEQARGNLSEEQFEHQGVLTEAGLAQLREYLNEVAPENFHPRMNVANVPTLFTVETMCKMVVRAMRASGT